MPSAGRMMTPITVAGLLILAVVVLLFLPDDPTGVRAERDRRYVEIAELGHERDPANLPALREGVRDPNDRVREAAVAWLARQGVDSEVPLLVEVLLADVCPSVRAASAQALGRFRVPAAGDALIAAMETDKAAVVRTRAAASLGRLVGVDVHYRASGPTDERREAIEKLRYLWGHVRASYLRDR